MVMSYEQFKELCAERDVAAYRCVGALDAVLVGLPDDEHAVARQMLADYYAKQERVQEAIRDAYQDS